MIKWCSGSRYPSHAANIEHLNKIIDGRNFAYDTLNHGFWSLFVMFHLTLLILIMAWPPTGAKSITEPMTTHFTNAYNASSDISPSMALVTYCRSNHSSHDVCSVKNKKKCLQVTFELYGHFRCLQVLYSKQKLHLPSAVLLSGFQSSLGALKSTE